MIESEGGKAILSLHTTDPMCIPSMPPTITAHPTWDGSFALRSRSGHFSFAVLEAGGLPFVWETPSGRFSVVCVLLVWVLFLWVQVWQFLLRWDPLFARLILFPRTLQPLLVIHTPPGLFYQVIRQWGKKKKTFPKTGFIKAGRFLVALCLRATGLTQGSFLHRHIFEKEGSCHIVCFQTANFWKNATYADSGVAKTLLREVQGLYRKLFLGTAAHSRLTTPSVPGGPPLCSAIKETYTWPV